MSEPVLIIAAFWSDTDEGADVASLLRAQFKQTDRYGRGQVVTFPKATADSFGFQQVMRRLDLEEMNARP